MTEEEKKAYNHAILDVAGMLRREFGGQNTKCEPKVLEMINAVMELLKKDEK